QYAPSIDSFIWLMQFNNSGSGTPNKVRIAWTSAAEVASSPSQSWSFIDLTSGFFGLAAGKQSMDYPDLSLGTSELHMSIDEVGLGLLVSSISLADLVDGDGSVGVSWTNPSDSGFAYGGHLTQNTGGQVYWAGHVDGST